jgi:type II secretory pathway component GspD/PulD (secretin)
MIRVITAAEQVEKPEAMVTKTFEIVYADVVEVAKALEKFKSTKGFVSSIQGTSYIMVTDTETKIRDITLFIEKIDRMTQQILVEARIYDITSTDSFEINVDWSLGRNVPITEINRTNAVTKTGNTSTGRTITANDTTGRTITSNDTTARTITDVGETGPTTTVVQTVTDTDGTVVDKTVTTTTSGTPGRTGDTTTTTGTTGDAITSTATTGDATTSTSTTGTALSDNVTKTTSGTWLRDSYAKSKPFMGGGFDKDDGGVLRFGLLNDAVDLDLSLSMLRKQIGAKLLANPRILVLDNETATFKAVREIPYQQLTEASGGGSIGTTAFREVGIELMVTPHVAQPDNMIRLQLNPVFSVVGEDVDVAGVGVTYKQPSVDRREAQTVLLVKSGQTVVLAGMRKKEVSDDLRKVPLLGDLPIVNKLFRYRTEKEITSELVVFVTPRIVEQPALTAHLTPEEKAAYQVTDFKGPKVTTTTMEKEAKAKE